MSIVYHSEKMPPVEAVIEVYDSSGIRRPTDDPARIAQMYQQASLIISAWDGPMLVGVARALTDYCYCCYLSDLAVRKEYQHRGIGKELIALTREKIGPQSMLLLLAAPEAIDYYPKLGFVAVDNGFMLHRQR